MSMSDFSTAQGFRPGARPIQAKALNRVSGTATDAYRKAYEADLRYNPIGRLKRFKPLYALILGHRPDYPAKHIWQEAEIRVGTSGDISWMLKEKGQKGEFEPKEKNIAYLIGRNSFVPIDVVVELLRADAVDVTDLDESGYPKHKLIYVIRPFEPLICTVMTVKQDYLICRTGIAGLSLGVEDFNVAKPPLLRAIPSRTDETGSAQFSGYTPTGNKRHATSGTAEEDQFVLPAYAVNDVIYAEASGFGGTGLTLPGNEDVYWRAQNDDGRYWFADPPTI